MPEVTSLYRTLQLGKETVSGTLVPATKRLQTVKMQMDTDITTMAVLPQGYSLPTAFPVSKEMAKGSIQGEPSYAEMAYILSSLFGAPTFSTPGVGIAQQAVWTVSGTVQPTPVTYSSEVGDTNQCNTTPFSTFNEFKLTTDRSKIGIAGAVFGALMNIGATRTALTPNSDVQTVTLTTPVGTWTISYWGSATSALAANATGAAVQAALQALSTIGTGNVAVTGPAGGPYVITFQGALANQLIPIGVLTQPTTSGTAAIVHTTPGVSIFPEPSVVPVVPNQVDLFIDPTSSTLGSTQMLRNWTSNFSFAGQWDQGFSQNSSLGSFAAIAPKAPTATTDLTIGMDTQGQALLTALRNGTNQYVRLQATGPTIEGIIKYLFRIDMACQVSKAGGEKDVNGFYARDFSLSMKQDNGWLAGQSATITIISKLGSL